MSDTANCFACNRAASNECPSCGRLYCDLHGEDICNVCLQLRARGVLPARVDPIVREEEPVFEEEQPEEASPEPASEPEPLQDAPDQAEALTRAFAELPPSTRRTREPAGSVPDPSESPPAAEARYPMPTYAEGEAITCFACEREPVQQCPRCGRPYCAEHGEELCAVCLQPASGVPSLSLYRGSLVALFVASLLAIWLIIQPPGSEGDTGLRPIVVTPTAVVEAPSTEGTQPAGVTTPPAGTQVPSTTATRPAGSGTPAATSTAASGGASNYTVVAGDSLSAICASQRPAMASTDCVEQIVTLNGLPDAASINIGQTLRLP